MNKVASAVPALIICAAHLLDPSAVGLAQPNIHATKQGTHMRVQLMNTGIMGRIAYSPFDPDNPGSAPPESLGLEYPIGRPAEHLKGCGLWVGGKVDTSASGNGSPIPVVSTAYVGGLTADCEFSPGWGVADSVWQVFGLISPEPADWDAYWGGALPFRRFSDAGFHCMYTDTAVNGRNRVPLGIKVIQSSFSWETTEHQGIQIIEYKIMNIGSRHVDSVYVGFFLQGDVGSIAHPGYAARNTAGSLYDYVSGTTAGYIRNPEEPDVAAIGVSLLGFSPSLYSPWRTLDWFSADSTPVGDAAVYGAMKSGVLRWGEDPHSSDTRLFTSIGPFSLPAGSPMPGDTLRITFGILLGDTPEQLMSRTRVAASLLGGSIFSVIRQGFTMKLQMMNNGTYGHISYPPFNPGNPGGAPPESLGLEYPMGSNIEHIWGGGIWVGGKLDTSASGTGRQLPLVSTSWEGWAGPYVEFYPGNGPGDVMWSIQGRSAPKPAGWDAYWRGALPYQPLSDNDVHCMYTDDYFGWVPGHIPLRLKLIQSSRVWNDPYAEGIQIIEYRLMNRGTTTIDSCYVGFFVDGDVGPISLVSYYSRNYAAFHPSLRLAYMHNPVDIGSTPFGVTLLEAPRPLDSVFVSFKGYTANGGASNDSLRYELVRAPTMDTTTYPNLSDYKILLGTGPFTFRPGGQPAADTLRFVIAIVGGMDVAQLQERVVRARFLHANGGPPTSVRPSDDFLPTAHQLLQNYPNPFNSSTVVAFHVARYAHVLLDVYDLLGRKVCSLLDDYINPGEYRTTFEGRNLAGGIYLVRFQAGDLVQTRKMVLVK